MRRTFPRRTVRIRIRILFGPLCLAAGLIAAAAAQDRPTLPGIGATDPRVRIDPNEGPWRAVGKLQATAGGFYESCTATLVAPTRVLTAAHCLFNLRTGRDFPASSLHFLVGFDGGIYAGHARVLSFVVGEGYNHSHSTDGSDWAALTLDTPLGTPDRQLVISDKPPDIGTKVIIGGYSQDHPLNLTADMNCRIVARGTDANGRLLMQHNCTATHGASGAPVLVQENGTWRIAGIAVAARKGAASGIAAFPGPLSP